MSILTEADKPRCHWCNIANPIYVNYHDSEWGVPVYDDRKLYEMLLLESFQAGLSWECILNKRENFRKAFDGFDYEQIACYDDSKLIQLQKDTGIVRNRLKIKTAVRNANVFMEIRREWGAFSRYIWSFTDGFTVYETGRTTSPLSDAVSDDLYHRGMKFVGSTIIYSYLQAIGVINSHEANCWMAPKKSKCNENYDIGGEY